LDLLQYRNKALGALAVKSLPLIYGGAVILFVNTHLSRDSELGVYSLSIATFFAVSLIGKSFALYPLIKFLAEGDPQQGTWKAGVTYWVGTQIACAALIWALAPFAPGWFNAPGLDDGMRWASWIILAFIPRDLASALLQSRREIGRLFFLEACYFLFAASGIVYFAFTGVLKNADQVLGLNLAGALLSTAAAPMLCFGRIPAWGKAPREFWKKRASMGRDTLGIGVGDMVYTQLDYHLLGLFMGASEVALYFAAKNFFRFYNTITQAINLLIFPTSSILFSRGEIGKLKELLEKVLGGYIGFLLIINTLVIIGADWLVALIYRGIFPDAANILRIFALASFFEPLYMVSENVLYGIGKPKAILIAMWTSITLFFGLSVILMPALGALGGSLTILGTLISLASIILFYLRKELGITLISIFKRNLALVNNMLKSIKT
jgi:O-antigen/teichoic acid export membrane protein